MRAHSFLLARIRRPQIARLISRVTSSEPLVIGPTQPCCARTHTCAVGADAVRRSGAGPHVSVSVLTGLKIFIVVGTGVESVAKSAQYTLRLCTNDMAGGHVRLVAGGVGSRSVAWAGVRSVDERGTLKERGGSEVVGGGGSTSHTWRHEQHSFCMCMRDTTRRPPHDGHGIAREAFDVRWLSVRRSARGRTSP